VPDDSTPQDALAVLGRFDARNGGVPAAVFAALERKREALADRSQPLQSTKNFVIGNNDMAVAAAESEAKRLGYSTHALCAAEPEGPVENIGRNLAATALLKRPLMVETNCWISGGEGTVRLAPEGQRGLGGRNQQTVLAALIELTKRTQAAERPEEIVILSGGTDGEDGPTDAAGAFVDWAVIAEAKRRGMDAADFLRRNDAYHFFEPLGALIKTGPTQTNVSDVRVVLTGRSD
jgi:glycerate-2-kinase